MESPFALVTGGSSGIGFAIATALAKRKFNLVLVSRDMVKLQVARKALEAFEVRVELLAFDLSTEGAATAIADWCVANSISLRILCNVAGIGGAGDYLSLSLVDTRYMIRLNTDAAVALTYCLLPLLRKSSPAYILNVSSMAGMAPLQAKNIYSATKSFLLFFSYSLRYQLKADGISVSCLCPGPVFTRPAIQAETVAKLGWLGNQLAVAVAEVGETAVRQTLRGKMIIVPGRLAYWVSVLMRMAPANFFNWLYHALPFHRAADSKG